MNQERDDLIPTKDDLGTSNTQNIGKIEDEIKEKTLYQVYKWLITSESE